MKEMIKCIGCGSTLQTIDENKEGYITEGALAKYKEEAYCQRCYQIQHYGKVTKIPFDLDRYRKQLSVINPEKDLVVLLIDALNLYGSFHPEILQAIKTSEVIVLINKVDVLPKGIKLVKFERRVADIALEKGLRVKKVLSISALKLNNLDQLINLILKQKKHKVYLLGLANTGKSTLVNGVIKKYYQESKDFITTSYMLGTTYDLIKIPLEDNITLIDTPGLISNNEYAQYLSNQSMKLITPKKYLKPIIYQLEAGQTIFVGGLFRLDILTGEKITVSTFFANGLYVHRTKLVNAQNLYLSQVTKQLTPPTSVEIQALGPLQLKEEVAFDGKKDLVIGGIGFIHITGENITIRTFAPLMIEIKPVDSFM